MRRFSNVLKLVTDIVMNVIFRKEYLFLVMFFHQGVDTHIKVLQKKIYKRNFTANLLLHVRFDLFNIM